MTLEPSHTAHHKTLTLTPSRAAPARARMLLVVIAAAAVLMLALSSSSASAGVTHPFVSSFGPGGPGTGAFAAVQSIDVDQATGDVYVLDTGAGDLYKFDPAGKPLAFSAGTHCEAEGSEVSNCLAGVGGSQSEAQIALDSSSAPTKGDIYVANGSQVSIYGPDGSSIGALTEQPGEPCGVAVDPSGSVYVGLFSGSVSKYEPKKNPAENTDLVSSIEGVSGPCIVAVDSAGNVFADTWSQGPITRFPGASLIDPAGSTLAVDPKTDELYVNEGSRVSQFGPHGEPFEKPLGSFAASGAGTIENSFGVALRGSSGEAYVSSGDGQVNIYGPGVSVSEPSVTILPATGVTAEGATLHGTVNPEGSEPLSDTSWHFEYSIDGEASWSSTAGGDAGTGTSPVAVQDILSGLLPAQEVEVRLVATNAGGSATSSVEAFTTTALAPDASTEHAQDITPDHATLEGLLNAHNAASTFFFEFGTSTSYGSMIPATQDGDGGSASVTTAAMQSIYGLAAETTYHYRLVAHNATGTVHGGDQSFTTTGPLAPSSPRAGIPGTGFLPDNRGWEQASPVDKHGADVMAASSRTHAAATETPSLPMAVMFSSLGAFGDARGTGVANDYMGIRTAEPGTSGWTTHAITPEQEAETTFAVSRGLDPLWEGEVAADLTRGVYRAWSPIGEAPNVANAENLYLRTDLRTAGPGAYQLLSACPACAAPLPVLTSQEQVPRLAGASADFSHVIFQSTYPLTADATAISDPGSGTFLPNLYESVNGSLRVAGVLPDGTVAASSIAGQNMMHFAYAPNAISSDGSRVVFTDTSAPAADLLHGTGMLYMRVNGESTVPINASEKTAPGPPSPAKYWYATPDGSHVFFTTSEQLTNDDINGAADVYRYDVNAPAGHHLTRLSVDHEPADQANDALGVIGASNDGSYVYFIALGQLVAGQPTLGNLPGIYEWHDGTVTYVGKLKDAARDPDIDMPSAWSGNSTSQNSRVTSDGRHMLFASHSGIGLTGADQGQCNGGVGCLEFYVYSADSHELQCASCDPSGAPPTTDASNSDKAALSASVGTFHLNHPLSDDGRHVLFSTGEPLVPGDSNGKRDVYEYDVPSGTVHLLSSGTDPFDSYFMDASANASDVFLLTDQHLAGWDKDQSYDLYDARVAGGFPDPTLANPACTGDSCHGPLGAPSMFAPPGSAALNGLGDLAPPAPSLVTPRPKPLTRAQKLAKALKACRAKHNRHPRHICESRARRKYAARRASSHERRK